MSIICTIKDLGDKFYDVATPLDDGVHETMKQLDNLVLDGLENTFGESDFLTNAREISGQINNLIQNTFGVDAVREFDHKIYDALGAQEACEAPATKPTVVRPYAPAKLGR